MALLQDIQHLITKVAKWKTTRAFLIEVAAAASQSTKQRWIDITTSEASGPNSAPGSPGSSPPRPQTLPGAVTPGKSAPNVLGSSPIPATDSGSERGRSQPGSPQPEGSPGSPDQGGKRRIKTAPATSQKVMRGESPSPSHGRGKGDKK
jgi:hypothetical protein